MPTLSPDEIATLTTRLNKLNAMLATGVRSSTLGSQTLIFNTTESLIKARDDLKAQLQAAQGAPRRSRQSYAIFAGRGYD